MLSSHYSWPVNCFHDLRSRHLAPAHCRRNAWRACALHAPLSQSARFPRFQHVDGSGRALEPALRAQSLDGRFRAEIHLGASPTARGDIHVAGPPGFRHRIHRAGRLAHPPKPDLDAARPGNHRAGNPDQQFSFPVSFQFPAQHVQFPAHPAERQRAVVLGLSNLHIESGHHCLRPAHQRVPVPHLVFSQHPVHPGRGYHSIHYTPPIPGRHHPCSRIGTDAFRIYCYRINLRICAARLAPVRGRADSAPGCDGQPRGPGDCAGLKRESRRFQSRSRANLRPFPGPSRFTSNRAFAALGRVFPNVTR